MSELECELAVDVCCELDALESNAFAPQIDDNCCGALPFRADDVSDLEPEWDGDCFSELWPDGLSFLIVILLVFILTATG